MSRSGAGTASSATQTDEATGLRASSRGAPVVSAARQRGHDHRGPVGLELAEDFREVTRGLARPCAPWS